LGQASDSSGGLPPHPTPSPASPVSSSPAMAVQKRKAAAKSADQLFKRSKAAQKRQEKEKEHAEEEQEEQEEEAEAYEYEDGEEVEAAVGEEEEQESEEDKLARREEEITAARKKELKAMPVGDLKDLVTGKGLEAGKKEDMVEAMLAHEAEARAAVRAHQAKIREVLVKKKDELEALSAPELKDLCVAAGTKGMISKQARVELLLKQWQDDDGVDKAIAKMARDAREEKLVSMDKAALRKLCDKSGIDAFVKEVIVERVVRHEIAAGRFARPKLQEDEEEESAQSTSKSGKAGDMVEALLANEANRKKERENKKQEEEAAANKRKELKAKSIEELKKLLTSKGQEPNGKKDELVDALFAIGVQEDAVAARKTKLKSLSIEELKQRATSKGLQQSNKKDAMVDALLAHEAKIREEANAWEFKIGDVLEKKRAELEEKTAVELKELCASKSLKLGVGKQERVETLLEAVQTSGEVDTIISGMAKEARRDELLAMDKDAVLKIGEETGVDLLVKEVMVERILIHEDEFGAAQGEEDEEKKRPAKKARTGKK